MNSGNTDFEKAGQVVLNLTDEQLDDVSGGWNDCDNYTCNKEEPYCRHYR